MFYLSTFQVYAMQLLFSVPHVPSKQTSNIFFLILVSVSSFSQVAVVAVVGEVLTSRALTSRDLQGRRWRPVAAECAQSWRRTSRSWSSARKTRSTSSCRVGAWRISVPRTNSGSEKLRSQVLDGGVRRRVRWRRDSEEDTEGGLSRRDDGVRWLRWSAPWGTGWWLPLPS